jgi:alcohol dehydrogenase class IV
MYGGMCLGPVNTAAVHALSYPLGSTYKIAHGLSNALLLPYVMRYNLPAVVDKYASIALALGVESGPAPEQLAERGIEKISQLAQACNVPIKLSDIQIPESDLELLAKSAMTIERLLVNNPREITKKDALAIYQAAY